MVKLPSKTPRPIKSKMADTPKFQPPKVSSTKELVADDDEIFNTPEATKIANIFITGALKSAFNKHMNEIRAYAKQYDRKFVESLRFLNKEDICVILDSSENIVGVTMPIVGYEMDFSGLPWRDGEWQQRLCDIGDMMYRNSNTLSSMVKGYWSTLAEWTGDNSGGDYEIAIFKSKRLMDLYINKRSNYRWDAGAPLSDFIDA